MWLLRWAYKPGVGGNNLTVPRSLISQWSPFLGLSLAEIVKCYTLDFGDVLCASLGGAMPTNDILISEQSSFARFGHVKT